MITQRVSTGISNYSGEFALVLFMEERTGIEHLAMIKGQPSGKKNILCRIHPECFTGDVLNSNHCDCYSQLHLSKDLIREQDIGILIYLRQEGRRIGLEKELKSGLHSDQRFAPLGVDRILSRGGEERTYEIAADILRQLEVKSVRLLTNNHKKAEGLQARGITVTERIPLRIPVTGFNHQYLPTKEQQMHHSNHSDHSSHLKQDSLPENHVLDEVHDLIRLSSRDDKLRKPLITVSYAQSLDGSITLQAGEPYTLSGARSLQVTHGLRAMHDAILIGVGTLLADDPLLTTRLTNGLDPKPIIVDSRLRTPAHCKLLQNNNTKPIVATTRFAKSRALKELESVGAELLLIDSTPNKRVDLKALLQKLYSQGIKTVMVEGGSEILTSFFNQKLVDILVLTIAPQILGGIQGIRELAPGLQKARPVIQNLQHASIGKDLMVWGRVDWNSS